MLPRFYHFLCANNIQSFDIFQLSNINIDLKKIEYEWASDFFVYHRWSRSRNMIAWVLFVKKCGGGGGRGGGGGGGGWGSGGEQITIDQLQSLKTSCLLQKITKIHMNKEGQYMLYIIISFFYCWNKASVISPTLVCKCLVTFW